MQSFMSTSERQDLLVLKLAFRTSGIPFRFHVDNLSFRLIGESKWHEPDLLMRLLGV